MIGYVQVDERNLRRDCRGVAFQSQSTLTVGAQAVYRVRYTFLDGSARESVERVRRLLDHWYPRLSVAARASVRPRSPQPRGCSSRSPPRAVDERGVQPSRYEVDFDGGGGRAAERRPDFFVAQAGAPFYVEATAARGASVLGNEGKLALAAALKELIDEVRTPGFLLGVHLAEVGPNTAARRRVVDPLREWLAEHDPRAVLAASERGEEPPRKTLRFGGWTVRFEAIALKGLAVRDVDDPRMIGTYTDDFAALDDARSLRRKLKRKATRYGPLDAPYVIALLWAGDFADGQDIADALLGSVSLRFTRALSRPTRFGSPTRCGVVPRDRAPTLASATDGSRAVPGALACRPCSPPGCSLAVRKAHGLTRPGHSPLVAPMSSSVRSLRLFTPGVEADAPPVRARHPSIGARTSPTEIAP